MLLVRITLVVAGAGSALMLAACGGKAKSVSAPIGSSNDAVVGGCKTKSDCPAAVPIFGATTEANQAFVGWKGEPVNWRIFGIDERTKSPDGTSSKRRITVLLNLIPEGSEITPAKGQKLEPEVRINWTPDREGQGKMEVIVRDMDRCEMDNGKAGYCDQYKLLDGYDKKFTGLPWAIKDRQVMQEQLSSSELEQLAGTVSDDYVDDGAADGNVVTVSNPNCGNPTTDAQIQQGILSTFAKALLTPGGLLQVGTTLFTNGVSGGQTPAPPTQC